MKLTCCDTYRTLFQSFTILLWFFFIVLRSDSRKYPYPTTGSIFSYTPPCLRKFQNALETPLALRIPNRSTPPPPMPSEFRNHSNPLRNCRFFLPTDLKSPLYIPNTFIKRKLILSLPPKEKNVHSAQETINVA